MNGKEYVDLTGFILNASLGGYSATIKKTDENGNYVVTIGGGPTAEERTFSEPELYEYINKNHLDIKGENFGNITAQLEGLDQDVTPENVLKLIKVREEDNKEDGIISASRIKTLKAPVDQTQPTPTATPTPPVTPEGTKEPDDTAKPAESPVPGSPPPVTSEGTKEPDDTAKPTESPVPGSPPPVTPEGTKEPDDTAKPAGSPNYSPRSYLTKADGYTSENEENLGRPRTYQNFDTNQHDEYMHHGHITATNGIYKPGAIYQLGENPFLDEVASGNLLGTTDKALFSSFDYVSAYASTGMYNAVDLFKTVDKLEELGVDFNQHPASYWSKEFNDILNNGVDQHFGMNAEKLKSEVEQLKTDFTKLHNELMEWSGSANAVAQEAIQCILGKFECTMGNIDAALLPSCEAADRLVANLDKLKEMNNKLNGGVGEGQDATPGSLQGLLDAAKTNLDKVKTALDNLGPRPAAIKKEGDPDENGKPTVIYDDSAGLEWDKKKAQLEADLDKAQKEYDAQFKAVEDHKQEMDKLLKDIIIDYYQVKNLVQTVKSFKEYFTEGTARHSNLQGFISSKDNAALLKYHDLIVDDFENFKEMPVITPLSGHFEYDEGEKRYVVVDYQVGDVLIHDDAHGYVYAVTEPWDPLHGTIKIACFDKDGNRIGTDLTIWDQREIVPIRYVKEYDPELYEPYPERFTTVPDTTPGPSKTPTPPDPDPPIPPTTTPPPEPPTTVPPTTAPPTLPPAPPLDPPTGAPVGPDTLPDYNGYVYGTNPPYIPASPHTGLESLPVGNVADSSLGFGALAGLAAGAAGLGLTGVMKDHEKDDEDDDKKESKEEDNTQ